MEPVEEYSKQIRQDAVELLKVTDLVNNLSEFGEVIIGGSIIYDLMWGPDIDLMILCDDPRSNSIKALQKMIGLRQFQKYEYGDFVKFKRENRPESYIMNLILPFNGQKWEIEVWFMTEYPNNQKEMNELIKTKLNSTNRKAILTMKKNRQQSGSDKYKISSVDIYRQVLIDSIDYRE